MLHKLFREREKEKILSNAFCVANLTWVSRPGKGIIKKELQDNLSHNRLKITHTYTHTYVYIILCAYVCVCMFSTTVGLTFENILL